MKKIANRRAGDRAEAFGAVLMQLFCAVASVPRQEDFGIVDAVATLLRRDEKLLYAEDSFSVQFKSRTEKIINYTGDRFKALMNQELLVFIAHVDLTTAVIRLFSVGRALAHPNIHDMKGVVVYVDSVEQKLEDGVLHISLGEPVLKWDATRLADQQFEETAYSVMKEWLKMERWNQRYRMIGLQTKIIWQTNEIPKLGWTSLLWSPSRVKEALTDLVPTIQMIAMVAASNPSVAEPVLQLIKWMREHGVDPDSSGRLGLMAALSSGKNELDIVLEKHPEIDVVARFDAATFDDKQITFWLHLVDRKGKSHATKHAGTIEQILHQGFDITISKDTNQIAKVGFVDAWLQARNLEAVDVLNGVFLFRKGTANDSKGRQ